jgi:tape measure domain-containing protein
MDGNFNRNMRAAQGQTSKLDSQFKKLAVTAAAAFSVQQIGTAIQQTTELAATMEAMDIRMQVGSRTQENYAANLEFLNSTIKDFKIPLMETTEGFSKYLGAVRGTALEGEKAREVFLGLTVGQKALKLSNEESARVFGALTKMISTGTVQADEFKGQLAEAMPGAIELGAKSMNMSMGDFFKNMEKGNIKSIEFVTNFSKQLIEEYGSSMPKAIDSMQSKLTDVNNKIIENSALIGQTAAPIYLQWLNVKLKLLQTLQVAIGFYERNKTAIDAAAKATAIFAAVLITYSAAMRAGYVVTMLMVKAQTIYRAYTLASVVATGGFKAAWIALNTAFAISPIGAIITAIAALTVGLVIAYQKSESFRAAMDGLGETGVQALKLLRQQFMLLLAPMRIIATFWTEGPKAAYKMFAQLKQETLDYAKTAADVYSGAAFQRGRARSFEKSRAQTPGEDNALGALGSETAMSEALKNFGGGAGASGSGSSQSVAGGRSVRNVSVRIDKQLFDLKVYTTTAKESVNDIKRLVQDAINRAVLDSEAAL